MSKLSHTYRWVIQPALVVIILAIGFIGAMSFSMFDEQPPKIDTAVFSPLVRVINNVVTTERITVNGNGTLAARTQINIVPQVGGRITYIHPELRAGGAFEAGETLVQIEKIDYELTVTQSEAEVASAQTALELQIAEAEAAREEWLEINPGTPVPTLVGREPQIAEARARLDSAKANLKQARLNLERTKISMPFTGRVVQAMIDVGEVVMANQQVGMVYNSERFEISVPLEIEELAWINIPDQERAGNPVNIHVAVGEEKHELQGEVTRIESELEEMSRFARVIVTLPASNIPDELKAKVIPGLFVDVSIISKELEQVSMLPNTSLRDDSVLWVVEDDKLHIVEPNIIYKSDNIIVIRDLKHGAQIITSDLNIVTEGMSVRVADEEI